MMIEKVVVPGLGMSFEYVILTEWFKNVGDYVKKDEPIAEATADKITMELSSSIDGYLLKQCYKVEDVIPVKDIVAVIGTDKDEKVPEDLNNEKVQKETGSKSSQTETVSKAAKGERKPVSPAARRLIKEYNLDLELIKGTDKDGMVSKKDVENYLNELKTAPKDSVAAETPAGKDNGKIIEVIPYTGIRKVIGDNLSKSKNTAVHVTTGLEVDMTDVLVLRKKLMKQLNLTELSIVAFASRAIVKALGEYPILNSELNDNEIIVKKYVNIGVAVSSNNGLIVPVIKDAHKKGFIQIANEIQVLTDQGRDNKTPPDAFKDGTISISNAGAFGSLTSTQIISQPQSAVLWMGKAVKKPAVVDDEIEIRNIMNLLCSYDHRVIDGSTVGLFLTKIKMLLESPESLIIS